MPRASAAAAIIILLVSAQLAAGEGPITRLLAGAQLVEEARDGRAATGPGERERRLRIYSCGQGTRPIRIEQVAERRAGGSLATLRETASAADQILLRLRPAAGDADLVALARALGGRVAARIPSLGIAVIRLATARAGAVDAALTAARASPAVLLAEPDGIALGAAIPDDPYYAGYQMAALASVDAPGAWDLTTGSSAVVVAVIDSGVDYNHPDLAANMWTNAADPVDGIDNDGDGMVDDARGWDWVDHDADPMDGYGHGTHVAGILGAVGGNRTGIAGACWSVRIMPLRVLNSSNWGYYSDWAAAMGYAAAKHVPVLSMSLGGTSSSTILQAACDEAAAAGCLIVVSAGNDGFDGCQYPAACSGDSIISVAACAVDGTPAPFSNHHATLVDLAAPGVDITSTFWSGWGGGYGWMSGTSMAAPLVSGTCALIKAVRPSLSAGEIRAAVLAGTDPLPAWDGLCATGGRLNMRKALQQAGVNHPRNRAPVIAGPDPVQPYANEDTPFELTLNATDADGDRLHWSIAEPPAMGEATITAGGGTCSLRYVPELDRSGPQRIRLEVSDGALSDTVVIQFDVHPVSDPPECTDPPRIEGRPAVDQIVTAYLGAWVDSHDQPPSDPSTFIYSWYWESAADDQGGDLRGESASSNSPAWQVLPADQGRWLRLNVAVRDVGYVTRNAVSAWRPVPRDANSPPTLRLSYPWSYIWEDDSVPADLSACDVDGDTLAWSGTSDPPCGTFSFSGPDGTRTGVFTPDRDFNGDTTLTFTVDDGHGHRVSVSQALAVLPMDDRPVLGFTALTLPAVPGEPFAHTFPPGTAYDVDGDEIFWTWNGLPAWMTLDPATGAVSGTPTELDLGATTAYVWIDAGGQSSEIATVTVQVAYPPPPPPPGGGQGHDSSDGSGGGDCGAGAALALLGLALASGVIRLRQRGRP